MTRCVLRLKINNNKHSVEFDTIVLMLLHSVTNDYGYYFSIEVKTHIDKMSCVLIIIAALTVVGNCDKSQSVGYGIITEQ